MTMQKSSSIWSYKPWWCQPWSIVLSGGVAIAASWLVVHLWFLSGAIALFVALWWWYFLILVPNWFKNSQE